MPDQRLELPPQTTFLVSDTADGLEIEWPIPFGERYRKLRVGFLVLLTGTTAAWLSTYFRGAPSWWWAFDLPIVFLNGTIGVYCVRHLIHLSKGSGNQRLKLTASTLEFEPGKGRDIQHFSRAEMRHIIPLGATRILVRRFPEKSDLWGKVVNRCRGILYFQTQIIFTAGTRRERDWLADALERWRDGSLFPPLV